MKASSSITLIHIVDGEDGISVISIDEQFSKSNSVNNIPTSNWIDTIPQRNEGEIIWKREVITYSNASTKILTPHPITGDKGDTGAPGDISIGLGYKINHTSLTSSNDGEIFAHGFTNGVASNVNGWIYYEGTRYTVIVGYLNPGSVYNSFPYSAYIGVRKSTPSTIVAIRFDSYTKTFLFIDSENIYTGTVDDSDWFIIGEFGMSNSELISYASFYNEGKSLAAIKEEELLKSGKLVIEWSANTIDIKALNNQGYISYNGNKIFFQSTSKSFTNKGEGIIIGNLNTHSILFCKVDLGDTLYNSQNVKTINFLDYETDTLITTRHEALVDYGFIKIGEFIIDEMGIVKTASIGEIEPLESYLQKAFMKLFKIGNISSSNFEDWLDALDLKNFYQTLVVSTLFVNSLIANDGQFLNSLKITKDNIDGELNENINAPALFQGGLGLNSDGSIAANWSGLDTNGYPKSGWKINGDGQSFFNGATIINANVKGLTADQISHDALKTIDEVDGATIDFTLNKNEWLSNDLFDNIAPNNIVTRENYNILCDGNSFDYFLKTDSSVQYLLYDTNSYTKSIGAGDNKILHTWTNNYGYPIFVETLATLGGSMNEIVWEITNGSHPRILSKQTQQKVSFILYPNETLRCRGKSWAWWGSQTAKINYVKFYRIFDGGKQHFIEINNRKSVNIYLHDDEENIKIATLLIQIIPSWVDYFYIFLGNSENYAWKSATLGKHGSYVNFSLKINENDSIPISPILDDDTFGRYCSYFIVDCRNYKNDITVKLDTTLRGNEYKDDNGKDKKEGATINVDYIDTGYTISLLNNPRGVALFDTTRREKKYFLNNTYYKNIIDIHSDSSNNHLTKVNKSDFVSNLYNSINSDLRDNWLVLTDSSTHYLTINGNKTYVAQLFITKSYIKAMLQNGDVATLIQDTRYNSLRIYGIVAGSTESIETGHIIPKTINRIIGNSSNPFQSAHINVVNASEVHGKVYAT
ncbi:MAG: hypothetical protein PQJ49_07725 [Sphaerochaetaceae bacterium]|nr:hypothetical protein [Sphaerochaetaceae bacterium]